MRLKIVFIFCVFCVSFGFGQKLIRTNINSLGNNLITNDYKLTQTVGQSSNHATFYSKNQEVKLQQGFQQPDFDNRNKNDAELELTVYPNPNKGSFSVSLGERLNEKVDFQIVDNQGRVFKKYVNHSAFIHEFDIHVPAGMYFVKVKTESGKSGIEKVLVIP